MKDQNINGLIESLEEVKIREYIYHSLNVEGVPYPQNVSLEKFNIWHFATIFEAEMGVSLNDNQLKKCKTVKDLVNICYSAVNLSPKACIDSWANESSKKKAVEKQSCCTKSKKNTSRQEYKQSKENSSSMKTSRATKDEIENRYQELLSLLQQTRDEVGSYKSKHKNISKLQSNMYMALDREMGDISVEIDNAMNLISWDNLVIAFFGETNAGKSTIIETFRILFEQNRKKGQDGLIVGDGRQDFTKDYQEYKMSIAGKPFTLIDVPGIEGNEDDFRDIIKEALHKAHCVFYVQKDQKPDSATAEKIKSYLGDWVSVYSIMNVRGDVSFYDEEEERETLLTSGVLKNEKLIKEAFQNILGDVYKGNISLQALLAMCAKASFSNKREDLQRNQEKLIKYFGNADEVLRFSQFHTIRQLVEEKASSFTDEIAEANKQKMISLARRSASSMENALSSGDIDTSDIEQKLKDFKRDVKQILGSAQTNLEQKFQA